MFESKRGKVLTVCLVIAIIAIIAVVCFFIIHGINADKMDKDSESNVEEFGKKEENKTPEPDDNNNDDNNEVPDIVDPIDVPSNNGGSATNYKNKPMYKGFVKSGEIEIPKNNLKVPIVEKVTKKSLEVAVGILYPANAKLNEPGNVVIAGHNYNNLFFSKNKNLKNGDKIYIKDETGRTFTYIVYDNFETTDADTSFYNRDTGGATEITLTTCVKEDSKKRTIIFARAQ